MILLGPNSVPEWGLLKWSMRETIFVLHGVGLIVILMLVQLLGMGVTFLLGSVTGVLALLGFVSMVVTLAYCWGRLSLVFPAIAVENRIGFKGAWKLSEGYEGLMMAVLILIPIFMSIPFVIGNFFALQAIQEAQSSLFLHIHTIVHSTLNSLVLIFSIAALSVTYKYISAEKAKAPTVTPEATPQDEPESNNTENN